MNRYYCHEDALTVTRLLFWALFLLAVAALAYAAGILTVFEDGSMSLTLGDLYFTGCPNPLALCAR